MKFLLTKVSTIAALLFIIPKIDATIYNPINGYIEKQNKACTETSLATYTISDQETCRFYCMYTYSCMVFHVDPISGSDSSSCKLYSKCTEVDVSGSKLFRKYKKPHMGYSTWNIYYKSTTEALIKEQVELMKQLNLRQAGYNVVHLDGACTFKNLVTGSATSTNVCTADKDCYVQRNSSGYLVDPDTCITSGMNAYVDWLHSEGYKVSWYTAGGFRSCNDHYYRSKGKSAWERDVRRDIERYKEWGIDILKIDQCGNAQDGYSDHGDTIKYWKQQTLAIYPEMEIENCKFKCNSINYRDGTVNNNVWESFCPYVAEYHRSFIDIRPWADRIFKTALAVSKSLHLASPENGWAYGDALEVCNYDFLSNPYVPNQAGYDGIGMTPELEKAHFGIWIVTSQPLFISTDLRKCSNEMLDLLRNEQLININQWYSGDAGSREGKTVNGRSLSIWKKTIDTGYDILFNYLIVDETESDPSEAFDTTTILNTECADRTTEFVFWNTGQKMFRSVFVQCIINYRTASPSKSPISKEPTISPSGSPTVFHTTTQPTVFQTRSPTVLQSSNEPTNVPTAAPTDFQITQFPTADLYIFPEAPSLRQQQESTPKKALAGSLIVIGLVLVLMYI